MNDMFYQGDEDYDQDDRYGGHEVDLYRLNNNDEFIFDY